MCGCIGVVCVCAHARACVCVCVYLSICVYLCLCVHYQGFTCSHETLITGSTAFNSLYDITIDTVNRCSLSNKVHYELLPKGLY